MTRLASGALGVAAIVMMLVGCGGDDGGTPSIKTSADNLCSQVAAVACHNLYQCCSESQIEDALSVTDPRTQDQCRDDFQRACVQQTADLQFSLKNKHVEYHGDLMDACLKAIVAPDGTCATVESMAPWTAACMTTAWVGTVATGAACDFTYECGEGNFCNASRLCAALPAEGQPCTTGAGCATGLFCDVNVCRTLGDVGAKCDTSANCKKGLFCDDRGDVPANVCAAQHAAGDACNAIDACAPGNTCLPGTCNGTNPRSCLSNRDCALTGSGQCNDANHFSCSTDSQCGTGTCSGAATACFSNAGCVSPSTCVFPVKCILPTCTGPVACGESHITVDYCSAVDVLPL